jgi:hypothetical protein
MIYYALNVQHCEALQDFDAAIACAIMFFPPDADTQTHSSSIISMPIISISSIPPCFLRFAQASHLLDRPVNRLWRSHWIARLRRARSDQVRLMSLQWWRSKFNRTKGGELECLAAQLSQRQLDHCVLPATLF